MINLLHDLDIYDDIKFFEFVYPNISSIVRYSTRPRIRNENVAEHSYFVTFISFYLYEKYKNKYNIDLRKLYVMSLIHDFDEIVTGDLVYDAKYVNNYKINFEKGNIIRDIFYDKDEYVSIYKEYQEHKSIESKIVKLADWISMLLYINNECKLGNYFMKEILQRAIDNVQKYFNKLG